MIDKIDYYKTIESKRLVFKGQKYEKAQVYFANAILIAIGLVLSFKIVEEQTINNPSNADYFVAIFFPCIIIIAIFYECKTLLSRDKLKEINYHQSFDIAKKKIVEAATQLEWELYENTENYYIFKTKFGYISDSQSVTIIFSPDESIYFNSINYPNFYLGRARFVDNYEALMKIYLQL